MREGQAARRPAVSMNSCHRQWVTQGRHEGGQRRAEIKLGTGCAGVEPSCRWQCILNSGASIQPDFQGWSGRRPHLWNGHPGTRQVSFPHVPRNHLLALGRGGEERGSGAAGTSYQVKTCGACCAPPPKEHTHRSSCSLLPCDRPHRTVRAMAGQIWQQPIPHIQRSQMNRHLHPGCCPPPLPCGASASHLEGHGHARHPHRVREVVVAGQRAVGQAVRSQPRGEHCAVRGQRGGT